uniref:C3H1-type domain-containing protein n=1 Tax=Quercus lobata TaxID=97700 RepID=A0A7N2LFY8_QUELO
MRRACLGGSRVRGYCLMLGQLRLGLPHWSVCGVIEYSLDFPLEGYEDTFRPVMALINFVEEKQDIVDSYKAKLKSIDCKHFDFGNGNCPFGSSCFYK